jgi:3-oxoacyl-[acyl-carrier protein] reductase
MTQAADLGTLRVLVNNAGGWLPGPQYPEGREWRRSVDLNLIMPMLAAQLAVPMMINSGGSIVNVSSSGGMGSRAYSSPEYGAAKAGLIRFTSCVANWADGHRIRVNCVCPGWTKTPMARPEVDDPEVIDRVTRTMALRKIATPEDIARQVVVLSSDELSGHVSGQIVVVAGGMEGRTLH